jgi:hypothetical protein
VEVAHAFIGWLQRSNETLIKAAQDLQNQLDIRTADCLYTKQALEQACSGSKGKTKQRLAKLETQVSRLIELAKQE